MKKAFKVVVDMEKSFDSNLLQFALLSMMIKVVSIEQIAAGPGHDVDKFYKE